MTVNASALGTGSRLPVSVLIQTKNEEDSIARCISRLSAFDEVIVVDSYSEDNTVSIAMSMGAKVVNFRWNGRYPKKKQWQLENVQTNHDWVLFLDADEYPSESLIDELYRFPWEASEVAAANIRLSYFFSGHQLRYGHVVVKRCLVRKDRCRFPPVNDLQAAGMGELEGHYQPVVNGRVMTLKARLVHEDLDAVSTWFDRHNRYSDWEAQLRESAQAREEVRALRSLQGQIFSRLPAKPALFFGYSYIIRLGFLDGRAGFEYAAALAFYYWQIELKRREILRSSSGI